LILHIHDRWLKDPPSSGKIFHLFCGPPISQEEFVEILRSILSLPIERISEQEGNSLFGKWVWESLTFSCKLSTEEERWWEGFSFRYPSLQEGLRTTILEYIEKVLPKTKERSPG
jgi:hypothetical protein